MIFHPIWAWLPLPLLDLVNCRPIKGVVRTSFHDLSVFNITRRGNIYLYYNPASTLADRIF
jgi:hypothetical protein